MSELLKNRPAEGDNKKDEVKLNTNADVKAAADNEIQRAQHLIDESQNVMKKPETNRSVPKQAPEAILPADGNKTESIKHPPEIQYWINIADVLEEQYITKEKDGFITIAYDRMLAIEIKTMMEAGKALNGYFEKQVLALPKENQVKTHPLVIRLAVYNAMANDPMLIQWHEYHIKHKAWEDSHIPTWAFNPEPQKPQADVQNIVDVRTVIQNSMVQPKTNKDIPNPERALFEIFPHTAKEMVKKRTNSIK